MLFLKHVFFSFYNSLGAKNTLIGWRAQLNSKVFAQHIESLDLFPPPPPHTHRYRESELSHICVSSSVSEEHVESVSMEVSPLVPGWRKKGCETASGRPRRNTSAIEEDWQPKAVSPKSLGHNCKRSEKSWSLQVHKCVESSPRWVIKKCPASVQATPYLWRKSASANLVVIIIKPPSWTGTTKLKYTFKKLITCSI